MKLLFCALALSLMLVPAIADDAATAPDSSETATQYIAPKPVKLDNGLTVTPIVLPYDEIGEMMGAKLWRFRIEKPAAPVPLLMAYVVLRTPGEPEKIVGLDISNNVSHEMELTLGLLPSNNFSLDLADRWRIRIHHREISKKMTVSESIFTRNMENPVKNLENVSQSTSDSFPNRYGRVQANGEVNLINFNHGPEGQKIDTELFLAFVATK